MRKVLTAVVAFAAIVTGGMVAAPAHADTQTVTYVVQSSVQSVTYLAYTKGDGGDYTFSAENGRWRVKSSNNIWSWRTQQAITEEYFTPYVQVETGSTSNNAWITCDIYVNGHSVAHQKSVGPYSDVFCID